MYDSFSRFHAVTDNSETIYLMCLSMFQIISFFLNYWDDWSAEYRGTLHETDKGAEIHIHELSVVFLSIALPAFLRKCLPPIQWLKLLLWQYFKGLCRIAAFSHPHSHSLPRALRKSLIYVQHLCSSSLRDITSVLLVQQIKMVNSNKPHPTSLLPSKIHWNSHAAFRN